MPGFTIKIDGDAAGFLGEIDKSIKAATGLSTGQIAMIGGVAGAAVAGIKVLGDFTVAASEDRAEQTKLETAYKNTGAAVGDYLTSIDKAIQAGADKAFSDSEVRAALTPLITATGDADKANDLLAKSMDIARAAGVDLETASKAVAKAAAGQDTALLKLLPGLQKGTDATDTIRKATDLAKGAADDYAESAEGMGKRGSDAFGELTEAIGSAFLPILDELLPALLPIITALGDIIKLLVPILVPAVKVVVAALKIIIDVLTTFLGIIKDIIDWVSKLIDALSKIKIPDIKLPSIPFLSSATQGVSGLQGFGATPFGPAPAAVGNVVININGDPATIEREVIRALRSYGRRTGTEIPGVTEVSRRFAHIDTRPT
jgi:phage-related protein